jgi:predicted hotdog family 3-hydroxylacyl-ACP dehydratase
MNVNDLPPIRELLPHQGKVLLLDRVLEHDPESTTTRVSIERQTWLKREDGSVASWVALEYMAQCIAAHEGIRAHLSGSRPVPGSLAAVVGVRLYRSYFRAGEVLRVRTRLVRGRPGLGVLSHFCTVHEDRPTGEGQLLVEGRLSIAIPKPSPSQ